ncbi:hypothetical protein BP5796_07651 [Coleophoma crateriformis]|uniref:Zn(2)-C6 fungal-type domain-containing protein n=1 Tax=Coleophoma crateriformis TaxID=565419 RepID=A0A3D8RJJ0_9HELO|nr:hypothetical protein BP5796_07651 [Coleophoma crateriformis]
MYRADRLPTRVSKACNRCKRQKQRCDFERPCRLCIHAGTECTTDFVPVAKKPRLRRDASSAALSGRTEIPEANSSQSQESQRQTASIPDALSSDRAANIQTDQAAMAWNSPIASTSTDSQMPPPEDPLKRANSGLTDIEADSALAITRKIFRFQQSLALKERATFAIPGSGWRPSLGMNSSSHLPTPLVPISEIIGIELPPYEICSKILETYFSSVHWFSLVVYEPKFRRRCNAIFSSGLAGRTDHGFLLLLLMILVMGGWYTSKERTADLGLSEQELDALRSRLLKVVQRDFLDLMDQDCLEFVQLCALLGSFYLYHGRPRSSFSILGAATKTAQAMDLHRDHEAKWAVEDGEERKRVWWTIYTWDRPFGINDKDCNVAMPSEILENVHFDQLLQPSHVCLSTYQSQLNLVYQIASPLLEDIYGMRTSHDTMLSSTLPEMLATANSALRDWELALPPHLCLDQLNDLTFHSTTEKKMHSLQAMSLQLTYDNLMIVLNRPMLADRDYIRQRTAAGDLTSPESHISEDMRETSFKRCFKSAIRISNLRHKQNLFSLARTTHLVSFLGMNLFTASVVLFICALADTLSDTAQEAKRGLRRTLQMQKALANYASLSMQCSTILEDLIQLILKKEMEEMLQEHSVDGESTLPELEILGEGTQSHIAQQNEAGQSLPYVAGSGALSEDSTSLVGLHFQQSLRTLQQVFHGNHILRHSNGSVEDSSTHQDYANCLPIGEDGSSQTVLPDANYIDLDGNASRVEDLGQFWLWNLEDFNY